MLYSEFHRLLGIKPIRSLLGFGLTMGITLAFGAGFQFVAAQEPGPDEIHAAEKISEPLLRSHIKFLADDLLEGRAPGSRGDQLARKYVQAELDGMGVLPAGPMGEWTQPVPLVGVKTRPPATLHFQGKQGIGLTLANMRDYVVTIGKPETEARISDAELVFVGYGIQAPEFGWDDYNGMDLSGKVLVMMNNDPADDPKMFGGKRRLYYGRWDYKYLMAARMKAAGAFIIHTTPSAGYPYQVVQTSWSGEEFELAGNRDPKMEMRGWLTEDAARKLVVLSGLDLDQLRAAAEKKEFRPVPLGTRVSMELRAEIRKKQTANVLGMIEGSDPELKNEYVIYMAHHDHIGVAETRDRRGDAIYNGALDNASGVASLLAIARAHAAMEKPTRRSILFASVGAEEQGLLGSLYFAQHPTVDPGAIAAVINMDGINHLGPTHDVNFIGFGKSSLDQVVESIARYQNRIVTPDQFPDKGYYYRSDQFSLAKIGVPGIYLHAGIRVIGKPDGWGKEMREKWVETNYHQPSDEYDDSWNLKGAVQDVRLLFHSGVRVANQDQMPSWKPGDEFEAARLQALKLRKERSGAKKLAPNGNR